MKALVMEAAMVRKLSRSLSSCLSVSTALAAWFRRLQRQLTLGICWRVQNRGQLTVFAVALAFLSSTSVDDSFEDKVGMTRMRTSGIFSTSGWMRRRRVRSSSQPTRSLRASLRLWPFWLSAVDCSLASFRVDCGVSFSLKLCLIQMMRQRTNVALEGRDLLILDLSVASDADLFRRFGRVNTPRDKLGDLREELDVTENGVLVSSSFSSSASRYA